MNLNLLLHILSKIETGTISASSIFDYGRAKRNLMSDVAFHLFANNYYRVHV